jgi:hypothetical protein
MVYLPEVRRQLSPFSLSTKLFFSPGGMLLLARRMPHSINNGPHKVGRGGDEHG